MADQPPDPVVDGPLRDYLTTELRQAELDFPSLPTRERRRTRGAVPLGIFVAAVAVIAFVVLAPRLLEGASVGTSGTPIGADGLPLSIDGEPVVRADQIGSSTAGGSFLAGGTLVLDTSPCPSGSAAAQLGCSDRWQLVAGPLDTPSATFSLDGITDAPGFVRTSGARTVARVHAAAAASGAAGSEILVVEAIAWRQPTKGPVPSNATPPEGGETNSALWPDFVSVWARDGVTIAGYAPKRYLLDPGSALTPGSPSNPPQPEPVPVYGEDLVTLVGHMLPGVGFVALGSTESPAAPTPLVAAASVAPSQEPSASPAPSVPASAGPSLTPSGNGDCGRISAAACTKAIALARNGHEAEVVGATRIVVDDMCPPDLAAVPSGQASVTQCDRKYPFDAMVVFVTAGADTTGWYYGEVVGLKDNQPTDVLTWQGSNGVPAHIVAQLRAPQPSP